MHYTKCIEQLGNILNRMLINEIFIKTESKFLKSSTRFLKSNEWRFSLE